MPIRGINTNKLTINMVIRRGEAGPLREVVVAMQMGTAHSLTPSVCWRRWAMCWRLDDLEGERIGLEHWGRQKLIHDDLAKAALELSKGDRS